MTVFVPADSKERSDESVIEFTVPIEAEATASPVAIVTSELAPGTPPGLQLPGSAQSELTAPVHVDLLMMRLLTLIAMLRPLWGRENLSGHRNVADQQEPSRGNGNQAQFTIDRVGALLSASQQSGTGLSQQFDNQVTGV